MTLCHPLSTASLIMTPKFGIMPANRCTMSPRCSERAFWSFSTRYLMPCPRFVIFYCILGSSSISGRDGSRDFSQEWNRAAQPAHQRYCCRDFRLFDCKHGSFKRCQVSPSRDFSASSTRFSSHLNSCRNIQSAPIHTSSKGTHSNSESVYSNVYSAMGVCFVDNS